MTRSNPAAPWRAADLLSQGAAQGIQPGAGEFTEAADHPCTRYLRDATATLSKWLSRTAVWRGAMRPMKLTLRSKGILAFIALIIYAGAVGVVLSEQSARLLQIAGDIEDVYAQENALAKASYSVSNSMLKWQETSASPSEPVAGFEEQVVLDVELAQAGLQPLLKFQPQFASDIALMRSNVARLHAQPSRASMVWLREHARELNERLDLIVQQVRLRQDRMWASYRGEYRSMVIEGVVLALFGAMVFGTVMALFLKRLAQDVQELAARALQIVSGQRGPPVAITRHDEIGDLMEAVNRMEFEMRRREQQLEIAHEQRFYKEKMAAIGSLAAAVAHEINNPIAAIAGIARSMKDHGEKPQLIIEQTKRIATISRQIAELTAPHPPEPELLDLNALVRNTCKFIAYDRRFERIDLSLRLDPQIPAVTVTADHLTQVLVNLVINAADALEDVTRGDAAICVATEARGGGEVVITVEDNGKGMTPEVLAHAFEASYTTKPAHKGRGLGLSLCKTLINGSGNRIELESAPGVGTTARIHLMPLGKAAGA